jgi:hypothetical protein
MPKPERVRETHDPDLLRGYLDRAHARIDELARELAAEQAQTRRLRLVIALRPFQPGWRHRRVPRTTVQRTTQGGHS